MHIFPEHRRCLAVFAVCIFILAVSAGNLWAFETGAPDFLPMIKKNCAPNGADRSPELYIVYYPDVLTSSSETATFACSHGFPWEVDTRVPLILYGKGVRRGTYPGKASLEDITPTLGKLLQVDIPETSDGCVLDESLKKRKAWDKRGRFVPRAAFVFTLDQCRADYLTNPMINPSLSFTRKWLARRGAYYPNARLSYAGSRTAVSHSVIGTGATPGINGIVGNNIKLGDGFPLAFNDGPRHSMNMDNLLVPTLSDVMDIALDNQPRIISISPYGRAALGMGGHGALFSEESDKDIILKLASDTGLPYTNGDNFTLPEYLVYNTDNPIRIDQWLLENYQINIHEDEWTEKTTVVDNSPYAPVFMNYINGPQGVFPDGTPFSFNHACVKAGVEQPESAYQLWDEAEAYPGNSYFGETMNTPFYQLWAVDMLLMSIEKEGVGLDRIPDLVYYNFKCLDKVGHKYGVNSPEIYTYLYYVDYCLRKITFWLNRHMGRNYVMVVTADHGAHNANEGRILYRLNLFDAIEAEFGEDIILNDPNDGFPFDDMIYLDQEKLAESGYTQADVALFVKENFSDFVYDVYTKDEIF